MFICENIPKANLCDMNVYHQLWIVGKLYDNYQYLINVPYIVAKYAKNNWILFKQHRLK